MKRKPNIVIVTADQWRSSAFGFAGDANARTPNIDRFRNESLDFGLAVSGCSICAPARAALLTGELIDRYMLL
jgi:arylsulfatase A-like enzyme